MADYKWTEYDEQVSLLERDIPKCNEEIINLGSEVGNGITDIWTGESVETWIDEFNRLGQAIVNNLEKIDNVRVAYTNINSFIRATKEGFVSEFNNAYDHSAPYDAGALKNAVSDNYNATNLSLTDFPKIDATTDKKKLILDVDNLTKKIEVITRSASTINQFYDSFKGIIEGINSVYESNKQASPAQEIPGEIERLMTELNQKIDEFTEAIREMIKARTEREEEAKTEQKDENIKADERAGRLGSGSGGGTPSGGGGGQPSGSGSGDKKDDSSSKKPEQSQSKPSSSSPSRSGGGSPQMPSYQRPSQPYQSPTMPTKQPTSDIGLKKPDSYTPTATSTKPTGSGGGTSGGGSTTPRSPITGSTPYSGYKPMDSSSLDKNTDTKPTDEAKTDIGGEDVTTPETLEELDTLTRGDDVEGLETMSPDLGSGSINADVDQIPLGSKPTSLKGMGVAGLGLGLATLGAAGYAKKKEEEEASTMKIEGEVDEFGNPIESNEAGADSFMNDFSLTEDGLSELDSVPSSSTESDIEW